MKEQELKKKLAEWMGWETHFGTVVYMKCAEWVLIKFEDEYKNYYMECPNFTQSLDTCFKHFSTILMLKGWAIFIEPVLDANFSMIGIKGIFTDKQIWERAEWAEQKEALALCLAIEKLIDREVTHD